MLQLVKTLAHLRRTHPPLRFGDFNLIWQADDAFAFLRRYEGQQVLVIINRGEAIERLVLPVQAAAPAVLWGPVGVTAERRGTVVRGLPAVSGAVIRL